MDLGMDEILTRLPAKSLMRFKCVSKLWSSHIRSRYFSNRFRTVPSRSHPRLYLCLQDLRKYSESVTVILSLVPATSSSFVVDHDLTIPQMEGYNFQNLGGLMCYTFPKNQPRIFNPATRQLVTLPALIIPPIEIEESHRYVSYYFGHDPVNEYKVICSIGVGGIMQEIRSEHWVLVLKPVGGSWKKVNPTPPDFCPHIPLSHRRLCIDGVMYYMAWIYTDNYVLVSFHIRSEEFKMIQVPMPGSLRLIDYGGKPTLLDHNKLRYKGKVKLWVLEDATNKEWSRKTLFLQHSQLHLVNNTKFYVRGTTENGKLFLVPGDYFISPFHVLCYDLQSNDMRKIEIKGIPDHWFSKDKMTICDDLMFTDQSESIMHLET